MDLAPTILGAINLKHGNHFFGRNLLEDTSDRPVFSFRYGTVARESGNLRTIFRVDGEDALAYTFDRNDVASYGALEGGAREKHVAPDITRAQDMARSWAKLLGENRLMPAAAVPTNSER